MYDTRLSVGQYGYFPASLEQAVTLSDVQKAEDISALPKCPGRPPNEIYLSAFVRRIKGSKSMLANPKAWLKSLQALLQHESLSEAVMACGAIDSGHEIQALQIHTRCLVAVGTNLRQAKLLQDLTESIYISAAILLLANFELLKRESRESLMAHLDAVATILRTHAHYYAVYGRREGAKHMSYEPDVFGMVYQAFRSIECIWSVSQMTKPLLTFEDYELLMHLGDCKTTDERDAIHFWRIMHVCASAFQKTSSEKVDALAVALFEATLLSWHSAPIIDHYIEADRRCSYIAQKSVAEQVRSTSIQAVVEASVLRVMCTHPIILAYNLGERFERVSCFLRFMIVHHTECNTNWIDLVADVLQHTFSVLPAAEVELSPYSPPQ